MAPRSTFGKEKEMVSGFGGRTGRGGLSGRVLEWRPVAHLFQLHSELVELEATVHHSPAAGPELHEQL